ncbi:MAG: hypothetical protein JXO72_10935 [Vicinamibacteria bacterium]|nr:hypothetical protein [Vicinamibacteria bacterium]
MIARTTIVMLMVMSAGAMAQEKSAEPGERPRVSREEMNRLIDEYLSRKIEGRLDLTTQQYARVMPLVRKLQCDRRHYARRRFETLRELRCLLEKGGAIELKISAIVSELRTLDAEAPVTIQRDMEAIDAVLSPMQQAKYRVIEFEVERRIGELRRHARHPREPPKRRPLMRESRDAAERSPTPIPSQ